MWEVMGSHTTNWFDAHHHHLGEFAVALKMRMKAEGLEGRKCTNDIKAQAMQSNRALDGIGLNAGDEYKLGMHPYKRSATQARAMRVTTMRPLPARLPARPW